MRSKAWFLPLLIGIACSPAQQGTVSPVAYDPQTSNTQSPSHGDSPAVRMVSAETLLLPAGQTSIQEVNSVQLSVQVQKWAGGSELVTEFLAPGEVLYERRAVTIPQSNDSLPRKLSLNLPVAGTHVQNFGLAGDWRIDIFIDGERVATQSFGLTP